MRRVHGWVCAAALVFVGVAAYPLDEPLSGMLAGVLLVWMANAAEGE